MSERYHCQWAWLPPGRVAADVLLTASDGRLTAVEPGVARPPGAHARPGLTLPGLANAHSHAFHRALRGRTHTGRGSFWAWREAMYALAGRLDPDTYGALARAVFAEMALAGFTSVGEFHYLHHGADGRRYDDANAVGHALVAAAREAGVRLCLLDACYLTGGIGAPLEGVQRRFGDGDAERWSARVDDLAAAYRDAGDVVVGAAAHSVRAVPPGQLPTVAAWARAAGAPLHAHLSEQPAENAACQQAYGASPTTVLAEAGVWQERATAVHAIHLDAVDVAVLGAAGANACLCPTTERDLADGVAPAAALRRAGARLTLGTDSHAHIDGFEEARAAELDLRLVTGERGSLDRGDLLTALTADGQASLGFDDAGALAVGARADLVTVRLDSVRTAGVAPGPGEPADLAADGALFAASAADVTDVTVDGRAVVTGGRHVLGDVAGLLTAALEDLR